MILAGDIGGTKCNLALYEVQGEDYKKDCPAPLRKPRVCLLR